MTLMRIACFDDRPSWLFFLQALSLVLIYASFACRRMGLSTPEQHHAKLSPVIQRSYHIISLSRCCILTAFKCGFRVSMLHFLYLKVCRFEDEDFTRWILHQKHFCFPHFGSSVFPLMQLRLLFYPSVDRCFICTSHFFIYIDHLQTFLLLQDTV